MWGHRPNPLRAAFGQVTKFTPANFGAGALFNNSTGAHLLRVWLANDGFGNAMQFSLLKGRLTTLNSGQISTVLTDQPAIPGALDSQNLVALPVASFSPGTQFSEPGIGSADFPFVILRPGWSLVQAEIIAAAALAPCFWWDFVYPEELYSLSAGDSAEDD